MENESAPPTPAVSAIPQRQRFEFSEVREPGIFFSSEFCSGNMHRVVRSAYDHYSIWTACDAQDSPNEGYPKSWFYFEVGGFNPRRVSFSLHRMHFLYAMAKRHQYYRPVFRSRTAEGQWGEWSRLPHPVLGLSMNSEEEMVLRFDYVFAGNSERVQFAFTYPYSYEQCKADVQKLKEEFRHDKDLLVRTCLLAKSWEGRDIDMVIVSSHEGREGHEVYKLDHTEQKLPKFRSSKPIIFVSARVHPIETPSSYTLNGILQFLLDKKDMRAHLLRKYFVFVLVPMLNPDGVARGHCRMDALNQNLNRYYSTPDEARQPSCFAVRRLCEHYQKERRLFMYLDLHAHPAYKGNFAFGNAIYEFVEQVESQLFPKILSQNCINFEFEQCIFSRKHMKARDRNQDVTKEGCGRVVLYKEFGIVHSYTLECGYHMNTYNNALEGESNTGVKYLVRYRVNERGEKIYDGNERQFEEERLNRYLADLETRQSSKDAGSKSSKLFDIFSYTSDPLDDKDSDYYTRQLPTYNLSTFHNLGRNILISILDIWNRNPYTRLSDANLYRKEIADRQAKLDRFRKEQAGIKTKQKRIVELIEEQFYGEWRRRNVCNNVVSAGNQRDKRRNHTIEVQKIGPGRTKDKEMRVLEMKTITNGNNESENEVSQTYPIHLQTLLPTRERNPCSNSQNLAENKIYYARQFKLSRGKLAHSGTQDNKEAQRTPSTSKELLGVQIKLSLEEELLRMGRHEALCVSSKVIRTPNFNACNLRVRNLMVGALGMPRK